MKITNISTYILRAPLERSFFSSQGKFSERNSLIVKVETDCGIVGWGEGGQYGPPEPVQACVEKVLGPRLIGEDPRRRVVHWEESYARTRDFGGKGPFIEAISALDIAFWDITGKAYGQPISELIGGAFRRSIAAYGTGFYYDGIKPLLVDEAQLRAECAQKSEAGFDIVKAKIGLLSPRDDLRRLEIIRDAFGSNVNLLVDCNHSYTFATARMMAAEMAKIEVLWFEEPVVPEDKESYRKLRDVSSVPIAGGEAEYTRFGFRDLILGGCVDIAQPDLCVSGGISEWMKIHALASAVGVSVVPHVWGSSIALAAAVQVLAATPGHPYTANPLPLINESVLEFDTTENPLRTELIASPFVMTAGRVSVPEGPGLGIEVDEAVLDRYCE